MKNRYEIRCVRRISGTNEYTSDGIGQARKSLRQAKRLAQSLCDRNPECETVRHRSSAIEFEVRDRKNPRRILFVAEGRPGVTVGERGFF